MQKAANKNRRYQFAAGCLLLTAIFLLPFAG
jgi:hypothetical protein